MIRFACVLAVVLCAWASLTFSARHYKLNEPGQPADQRVLVHRDSAYTAISWVATPGQNTLQLRFFDRVEGGVCLEPTWAQLIELAKDDPRLAHLVPAQRPTVSPAEPTWPAHWPLPDPGTVNSSPYISLFPAGLLLNDRLMQAAGGDLAKAAPKVLIVGLGSGVGSAQIFHHCPKAEITVVDIDRVVIEMVRDHYPLLKWMEQQGRLKMVTADARSFIRYQAGQGEWDLVILDAYTAGSPIPPHLMTREFFAQCAKLLNQDGVLFANVIGSYASERSGVLVGQQHKVLGGAIRSMRATTGADLGLSGEAAAAPLLPHGWVIPVFTAFTSPEDFERQRTDSRNNIVLFSRRPIEPRANAAGWKRLREHVPLRELPTGRWTTTLYKLISHPWQTALIPERFVGASMAALAGTFRPQAIAGAPEFAQLATSGDPQAIALLREAAIRHAGQDGLHPRPHGFAEAPREAPSVARLTTDWVLLPREVWRVAIGFAERDDQNDPEALVGPRDGTPERAAAVRQTWSIRDAPLFTDQSPNADIWNR